jgi:3-hydroxybutyrate dehydrogenase
MLKGKAAVITGSTSGIGLGIARELARRGADIVLNVSATRRRSKTSAGIERDHGVRCVYDGADMSKGEAVRGLIHATVEKFGHLDILVNNAGIQFTAPVDEFPAAKWQAILDINLSAAFHGIAAAVPQMKQQRWGRIVNIASAHGLVASTHKAAYVAAKHGLVGLTKVVGLETAGSGVTCNAVCPGWVRTPWSRSRPATSPRSGASVRSKPLRSFSRRSNHPLISYLPSNSGALSPFCARPQQTRSPARQSPSMAVGPRDKRLRTGLASDTTGREAT